MKRPDLLRHREVYIHSMEVLIGRYERAMEKGISKSDLEREDGEQCLLCNPIGIEENQAGHCDWFNHQEGCEKLGCPWMVMEDMTCDKWSTLNVEHLKVYQSTDPTIQQARIDQLREWIEAYKNFEEEK